MHAKKKICFQVLDAYSLFDNSTSHPFGGAEFRAYTFMNELKKDLEVSAIVRDHGQPKKQKFEGITVISHPYHVSGQKTKGRSVFGRLGALKLSGSAYEKHLKYGIYAESGAAIFCAFEITSATLLLSEYCKEHNKPFFLFIASDAEVSGGAHQNIFKTNEDLFQKVIHSADKIFVQNKTQLADLKKNYGKEGILLKNPVKFSDEQSSKKVYDFLWVGKSNAVKQPLEFVKLAAAMPHQRFFMVMNDSDKKLHAQVLDSRPANLTIVEFANPNEMDSIFRGSKILVCTSLLEGFPNTFLQAAKHKLPVLSSGIDPDGYVSQLNCGVVTGREQLGEAAKKLVTDEALVRKLGENAYQYARAEHDVLKVTEQLKQYFA